MQSSSRSWRPEVNGKGELYEMDISGWIRSEFRSADFGDERLTDRLVQIGDRLGSAPAESIPNACENWASTKATYRFCDNKSVDPNKILDAHKRVQRSQIRENDELLVVSDTTELVFPRHPSKEGLGDIGNSKTDLEGVKVHSTIGLDPEIYRMTGVIDQQSLIEDQQAGAKHDANGRAESIQLESEHEKWIRGDWLAEQIRPISIHDRGADAFAFYREVPDELDAGFVVRANQNRCIQTPVREGRGLMDWSGDLPEQGLRPSRSNEEVGETHERPNWLSKPGGISCSLRR